MFFKKKPSDSMIFEPMGQKVALGQAESILDLALKNKIHIDHSCGGSGSCGTCRVKVIQGGAGLAEMNFVEEAMARSRGFSVDERLACQVEPIDGLVVMVPDSPD